MLLTAMQISLSKAARAPGPGEREFERARRLGELTSNDILGGGAPEGYKVLSSQLWAPLGEVISREVVEDDVEGDFVGSRVLGTDVLCDLGDGRLAADELDARFGFGRRR